MPSASKVNICGVEIGGGAPIRVESMLKTRLDDVDGCLKELDALTKAGCELVRAAYPDESFAEQMGYIASHSPIPIMADIHFSSRLALSAIECGCRAIRINPGNMRESGGLRNVVDAAAANDVVIRIGANGGSLSNEQVAAARGDRVSALVDAVAEQVDLLTDAGFFNMIISAKSSSVGETVRTNLALASRYPFPIHIGITEAGPGISGTVKGSVGIGLMLAQGVGDTLRVSLTGMPESEVETGWAILNALGLRTRGADIISCPGCGRRRVDVFSLVERVRASLPHDIPDGTRVAVMGCEVNGPKEASHADIGIAGTQGGFVIFKDGVAVRTGRDSELDEALKEHFQKYATR